MTGEDEICCDMVRTRTLITYVVPKITIAAIPGESWACGGWEPAPTQIFIQYTMQLVVLVDDPPKYSCVDTAAVFGSFEPRVVDFAGSD